MTIAREAQRLPGLVNASGRLVMPGMIDPHVHIGHGAPHASEFWTDGCSAVVGGVTTLLTYYRRASSSTPAVST